jgi:hypothetical protein
MPKASAKASVKDVKFAREYFKNGFNGRAAAKAAGYKGTPGTLDTQSTRMLKKAKVQAELARLMELSRRKDEITIEKIEAELWSVGGIPAIQAAMMGALSPKVKACELLGKQRGAFGDKVKVEHSGRVTLKIEG